MDDAEALDVLGLRGPVDAATVKQAYRQLARELHPDVGGDAERFHRVRAAYDRVGSGTDLSTGPAPQERRPGVEDRWWDTASIWHDDVVDVAGVRVDAPIPDAAATRADLDLLATLLHRGEPVAPTVLHSRSPGSRLHRILPWLQPDLLAQLTIAPAPDGPRTGHDIEVRLRTSGGRGRRHLAAASTPAGWTRSHGSETVRLARRFRPSRVPSHTAIRLAREVDAAATAVGWPLREWFLLRV